MGLDISKYKTTKSKEEIDYFRFNWTGVSNFQEWCGEKGLPPPFPNWRGGNDGDTINLTKEGDRSFVQAWIDAYAKAYPDDAKMGVGGAMREIMFRVNDAAQMEPFYKAEYRDWNRTTALGWYWFLKDGLERRAAIKFW